MKKSLSHAVWECKYHVVWVPICVDREHTQEAVGHRCPLQTAMFGSCFWQCLLKWVFLSVIGGCGRSAWMGNKQRVPAATRPPPWQGARSSFHR